MALKPEPTAPFHSVQYALRVLETVSKHGSGVTDTQIFDTGQGDLSTQGGFSLRLVRGLSRIAGGELVSSRDSFALLFPRG